MNDSVHETRERIYFPNLNALRFIAAFLVFLNHLAWTKDIAGLSRLPHSAFTINNGVLGVNLFFTLSGFLITYLLLAEQKKSSTINIRQFYCRRILRIWPLYYLTVLLSFAILPFFVSIPGFVPVLSGANYWPKLGLFLGLMPNVAYAAYPLVSFGSQLWTVGVEEQFYVMWPWLVRTFIRNLIPALVTVVIFIVIARIVIDRQYVMHPNQIREIVLHFIHSLRIQCMAFGAIGAWLVHRGHHVILDFIFLKWVQIMILVGTIAIHVTSSTHLGGYQSEVAAVLHTIIIINAAANPRNIFRLEHRVTNYLGRISYGIYVYQILALNLAVVFAKHYIGFAEVHYGTIVYGIIGAGLTLLFAGVSYHWFELPFLRHKSKYSTILSAVQSTSGSR